MKRHKSLGLIIEAKNSFNNDNVTDDHQNLESSTITNEHLGIFMALIDPG